MKALLEGKQVVITGSDGGLGPAVVQAFLDAGATCHLPLHGEATAGADRSHTTGHVDLTDEAAAAGYYASLPPLFASVHLAGGFRSQPVAEISRRDLEQQLLINLTTAFLCCREAVTAMRRNGGQGGRIVNVAARVVEQPAPQMVAYTISKGAVASLTRALSAEVRGEGILVNAILPSIIDTPANRAAMPDAKADRWPKPAELARTVLWLASPDNLLTSGALIPVYGMA